jgi:mono/diheme cytochrome c family protein
MSRPSMRLSYPLSLGQKLPSRRQSLVASLLACLALAGGAQAELVGTFTRDGITDSRMDRFPAIHLQAGEPATPFLTAGPFQAVWKGSLVIPRRERLVFSFEGQGTATLKIDGKEVLTRSGTLAGEESKSTRLNPGEHEFELSYTSNPDGTAEFRIYWEEPGFTRQTMPPSAFKAVVTEATALGALQRRGRLVFTEQNCVKCHSAGAGFGATPMPETNDIAPILFGTGDRASEEWLRKWIADPQILKPSTHMPDLVDASTPEGLQRASDLAAFLAGMKSGAPAGTATDPALADEGGVHFHELGCVACHNSPDKGLADPSRVPLNNVASKYLPGALATFLKKPDAYHPAIKMPDFRLSDAEANSIAAYLTKASTGKETPMDYKFPAGDAARGAEVAATLQCGVCHPGLPMDLTAAPLPMDVMFKKDWAAAGCVAPADKRGKAPKLTLHDDDRTALIAFSKMGSDSLSRDTGAEYAVRQVEALRCTSCHSLDGEASLLSSYHHESAALVGDLAKLHERVDQTRPQLSFVGEMLHTTALEAMIDGTVSASPRPWLAMRMPGFHNRATPLANGLSKLHGLAPNQPEEVKVDAAMAQIGKELVSATGFGCITCHGVGEQKPTAAFEVEGINLSLIPSRLRSDYYHRWMDNPRSITPSTKMPSYSKDNKSQRTDVLEGDAKKQFDAIWQYIHQK